VLREEFTKSGCRLATATATLAIAIAASAAAEAADSAAAKDLADKVRGQGLACTDPVSAKRDPVENKPDEPVWILACQDARYRVRLMGDMAAKVERLQ
jgi:hypothetical protein